MLVEPDLDRAALAAALQRDYGLAASAMRFVPVGETAWCYQVTDEHGGRWFLKLGQPSAIEPARAEFALQLGRALAQLGLPVPRPQPTRSGALWCWLEGLRLALFEFIDGQPLSDQDLSAAGLTDRVAGLAAAIHGATGALAVSVPVTETFEVEADGLRRCLALADDGLRLQVPLLVGLVVDPLVPTKEPQESTTVTPAEIIYHRRVQVLDRAGQTSVTEACRTFGISRTTYYRWAGRAQRSGLAALVPKGRRPPVMPTATPPDQVEVVLAEAVARPTLGARQLVWHLAERGVRLSPSGVQKILGRHRLGRRAQRVAALAQLTAATTGILTSEAKDGPFGFCHFAARPGDLVALDTFYVGKLKGIGPVWQLTAVDTATRYAIGALVAGDKSARDAAAFVDHVAERLAGIGVELTGVLTDNGPEFTGRGFTSHLEDRNIGHRRIPPRSPNHNAVCERFQGTALQEFYRPAFHRQHFARLADLNAQFQGWLQHYNTRRRNHGDFMRGRTPFAVMQAHLS